MSSFWQMLERLIINIVPALLTTLMVLVGAALSRIPGAALAVPSFGIITVYYWCMFFPGTLPYTFLFILGLMEDTLAGLPLGFSSFLNILFACVLIGRFHMMSNVSFASIWWRFVILSFALIIIGWFIISLYYGRLLPVLPPLLQWGSSCLAYPAIHFLLMRFCHALKISA